MKKIESNNLVVKSNQLIEAKYRLTATEQKIIYMVTRQIQKDDQDFKLYNIKISELIEIMGINSQSKYTEVKKVARDLMKKVFTIIDLETNKDLLISWFSSVEYKNRTGIVEFEFSPKLKPFLLQLKKCFTQFDINNIMQLRSRYSLRIYELLLEYKNFGKRSFTIQELRELIGIEKKEYPLYANFKINVILQAQKEINEKTDISFDFEENKFGGRKVVEIKFIIKSNKKAETDSGEEVAVELESENHEIKSVVDIKKEFKKLYEGNLKDNYIKIMLKEKGIEHIRKCLLGFRKIIDGYKGEIDNVGGLFRTYVLKGDEWDKISEKPTTYKGNRGTTPSYANFEQREYPEEYYEKFYANLKEEPKT